MCEENNVRIIKSGGDRVYFKIVILCEMILINN